jgi:acetoin utilization deacetylase AcuC-like enzyme
VHLYRDILTPLVQRYAPDLILIVAGFDAHHEDPIGRMRITESAFSDLTRLLLHLRAMANDAPMLFALEGGYSNRGLSNSIRSVLKVLTTQETTQRFASSKTTLGARLVAKAHKMHAPYGVWTD